MRTVHYKKGEGRCARCGGELLRVILAPDPDCRFHLTPLCGQCATPKEKAYAHVGGECPGCGIAMRFSHRDAWRTRWVTCSTRCYQRAWRRSRRIKLRACEGCHREFQSSRKDARFCSNACRQMQYRARLAQNDPDAQRAELADIAAVLEALIS
jgi:ssDNA-binding Zn-finger/Zn-ribbon topoisomerase 1